MKRRLSNSIVLQVFLFIALIALLIFFFELNNLNSSVHKNRVKVLLLAERVDAELDQVGLQILTASISQFDSLSKLYTRFDTLMEKLSVDSKGAFNQTDQLIMDDVTVLTIHLQTKLELIERLKTQSALVRNGLLYLPTLSDEFHSHRFAKIVSPNDFVTRLMAYRYFDSDSSKSELLDKMDILDRWVRLYPEDKLLENFQWHLIKGIDGLKKLSGLKQQFIDIPTKNVLESLRVGYLNYHEQRVKEAQTLSIQLLILCSVLVACLIFILRRLDSARVVAEEASNLLHDAVEKLSEGFALYSAQGTLRFTNSRWLELYGVKGIAEYPLDLEEFNVRKAEFIEEETEIEDEATGQQFTLQKTKNGRWLQARDTLTSDGGWVCIRVDITDYKQAEHQLRKLGSAVEQSPTSIVITDVEGVIEYVNPKFEELAGYSFEEVKGKNSNLLKSGYTSDSEYASLWLDLLAGKEWKGIFSNRKKDGSEYWESATISPIRDESGSITNFVAVKEDITQQKANNDYLKMAATVLNATSEGIMTTDATLRITAVNPAFTEITGYREDEVLGKKPTVLSSGKHGPAFYKEMWKVLLKQGRWASEIWNRKKDGTDYPQWLSINMVANEEGEVSQYIAILSDISERKAQEEKIHYQAYFDGLTGLPNRSLLMDRIEHDLKVAKRKGHLSSLLFVDLDRFKRVNDTMGHEIGDRLLQEVADRLKAIVRSSDTISRFGGDEFVVYLTDIADPSDVAHVAEKIVHTLSKPFDLNGFDVFTGASVGIALAPVDASRPDELLRLADLAMYKAKESGRNQYHFFARKMQDKVNRRVKLEHLMRKGLEQNEFSVYYQPIIDCDSNTIFGFEALARWTHPEEGMIPPVEFIPVAEESGLIAPLGEWILEQACTDLVDIRHQHKDVHLSVNVSSRQYPLGFDSRSVQRILDKTGVEGSAISLEITESILLDDDPEILNWLNEFRALGVGLSIDDFGTGYSSLSYLKRFPINYLKIDQAFIASLNTDDDSTPLVTAIIAMARSLNMKIIAEGIEQKTQLATLQRLSCHYAQGYYFAKPMPKGELLDWIDRYLNDSSFREVDL